MRSASAEAAACTADTEPRLKRLRRVRPEEEDGEAAGEEADEDKGEDEREEDEHDGEEQDEGEEGEGEEGEERDVWDEDEGAAGEDAEMSDDEEAWDETVENLKEARGFTDGAGNQYQQRETTHGTARCHADLGVVLVHDVHERYDFKAA